MYTGCLYLCNLIHVGTHCTMDLHVLNMHVYSVHYMHIHGGPFEMCSDYFIKRDCLHKAKFIPSIWVICFTFPVSEFVFVCPLGFRKNSTEDNVTKQAHWILQYPL